MEIEEVPRSFLCAASYNVHRCVGLDRRFDPDRIARVIGEIDADIIGLQEIDSRFYQNGEHGHVDYLAKATGLNAIMGPTLRKSGGRYGNGLFTKHDIRDVRRIDLSVPGRQPRGAIDVELDVNGESVRVVVAHLGLGLRERRRQVKRLCEVFCSDQKSQIQIVLGDFNEWMPKGKPLCWIHDHFGKPPARLTFPSVFPLLALDRIWIRPLEALVSMRAHVTAESRIASDHLPVKAYIDTSQVLPANQACCG
ncbi:MAG: endonuclease/exonuclease/phosphatase family protein [Syntrophobacteraceae bacterium]|nr:endonuclease/exonuclease/phosphatase family protein [Desulfobacteraceae bacterium]